MSSEVVGNGVCFLSCGNMVQKLDMNNHSETSGEWNLTLL